MKKLTLLLLLMVSTNVLLLSNSTSIYALDFQPIRSNPEDRFAISVPNGWNSNITPSVSGKLYAFWDGAGNALTVDVGAPNSFKPILKAIENNKISKTKLLEIQQVWQTWDVNKLNLLVSISTVANRKMLTKTLTYKQESLDTVIFVKSIEYSFLYDEKQYSISYTAPPAYTIEEAEANFDKSYQQYLKPILITFFLQ